MKLKNRNKVKLEARRVSAASRKAEHAILSPEAKLAKLDQRLGQGVGAAKERTRLQQQLQAKPVPVTKATAEAVFGVETLKKERKSRPTKGQ